MITEYKIIKDEADLIITDLDDSVMISISDGGGQNFTTLTPEELFKLIGALLTIQAKMKKS